MKTIAQFSKLKKKLQSKVLFMKNTNTMKAKKFKVKNLSKNVINRPALKFNDVRVVESL